ncbi:MAG TPA: hemolysin family protein [Opitutaceae bacterium]|nr:hemolysin family protein [Opitutaceae bacterium]
MPAASTELFVICCLLLVNGLLAMAEIAVVSARKARLQVLADRGDPRARLALGIAEQPTRFLSTIQIGITLIGILAGVFGGARLADNASAMIAQVEFLSPYADALGIAFIVSAITLASVIVGELIPKRLALHSPERVAMALTGPIGVFARIVAPVANALAFVTDRVLRLFGIGQPEDAPITEDEVRSLIRKGIHAGTFHQAEEQMVEGVLALDQLPVTALMTPRPKIVFLNLDDSDEVNWRKVVASGHSYFPVYQTSRDQVVGLVAVKALWAHSAIGLPTALKNLLVPAFFVPETMNAMHLLEQFKKSGKHLALVSDEFGTVQGLVTLKDVLEAIVGALPEPGQRSQAAVKQREDGSWLIDATLAIDELKELLRVTGDLPHEDTADFQTLGGFVMTHFGRIPAAGDHFTWNGWRFEVMDMDRHRIDKMLVSRAPDAAVQKASA